MSDDLRFWLPIVFPTITVALTCWKGVAWILVGHTTLSLGQAKLAETVTTGHERLEELITSKHALLEAELADVKNRVARLEGWRDRQTN